MRVLRPTSTALVLPLLLASVAANCGGVIEPDFDDLTPPASAGHALIFHDSMSAVLLVNAGLGGMQSPASSAHTKIYKWSGSGWTIIDSAGPPVRNLAGVAYDAKRNTLVIHGGGYSLDLMYDETWTWRPDAGWLKKATGGPGRRDHTAMVYDAAREKIVLFGGQLNVTTFPAETWTWDGNAWTQAATTGPSGRVHHTMVYDAANQRVLLVGGAISGTSDVGDTWAWNGTSWSSVAPAITPRTHATLARTSQGIILLGGMPDNSPVLLLGANGWTASSLSGSPSRRFLSAMAYDASRQTAVLFGGGNMNGMDLYNDTWELSATGTWRKAQ